MSIHSWRAGLKFFKCITITKMKILRNKSSYSHTHKCVLFVSVQKLAKNKEVG